MAGDSNFDSVVLLLPFDGSNASTTLRDRSNNRKAITVVGDSKISTAQSKFNGASCYFDGTGDYLTAAASTDFEFGTGDFTVELWSRTDSLSTPDELLAYGAAGTTGFYWSVGTNGSVSFGGVAVGDFVTSSAGKVVVNTWYHLAVTRSSGTFRLFINGVLESTNTPAAANLNAGGTLKVGINSALNNYKKGYIDDLRITKGVARYTGTFPLPTTPHPIGLPTPTDSNYANVSLLLNADGSTIVDESPNPKALTAFGNVALTKVNSKVGAGCLVFDGTGDYLTATASTSFDFGTGDFTMECWVNAASLGAQMDLFGYGVAGATGHNLVILTNGAIQFSVNTMTTAILTSAGAVVTNTWYHIAVARASGVFTLYKNGVAAGSYSATTEDLSASGTFKVGTNRAASSSANGYIDALRITKGVARYAGTFPPPNYVLANWEVVTLTLPLEINVAEWLSINLEVITFETYSQLIPLEVKVFETYTLEILTLLDIRSSPFTRSIKIGFINYETYSLSKGLSISITELQYRLQAGLQIANYETLTLALPTRIQVYPVFASGTGSQRVGLVVQPPENSSQQWSLKVLLNGIDVSNRLTGTCSIDAEESSAVIAVFALRPENGLIDPYAWVKAAVQISYMDTVNNVDYLLFTGVVDTPVYDTTSRVTEFTCTDNLQNVVTQRPRADMDALTPEAKWSKYLSDETANTWDYLQERLATYPYAVGMNLNGELFSYSYQTSTILYEFTSSTILEGSMSVTLANAKDIVNEVTVNFSAQVPIFKESAVSLNWLGNIFDRVWDIGYTGSLIGVWSSTAEMAVSAISGAGGTFVSGPSFSMLRESHWEQGMGILNPGQELIIEGLGAKASKRFVQTITDTNSLTIKDSNSITQLGVIPLVVEGGVTVELDAFVSDNFTNTKETTSYYCSGQKHKHVLQPPRPTITSYEPTDPLLFVSNGVNAGWVTYPLYPVTYTEWDDSAFPDISTRRYILDEYGVPTPSTVGVEEIRYDFDDYTIVGNKSERAEAYETLAAQGKQSMVASHRQNRVAFSTFINPVLQRGMTLRANTPTVIATGVAYQISHSFDIDKGSALTNVTLAISSSKAIGIQSGSYNNQRLSIRLEVKVVPIGVKDPVVVDESVFNYYPKLSQIYTNKDDFVFDANNWGGFFSAYKPPKQQEWVIQWPELSEASTGNTTVVNDNGIIEANIPNDELFLLV